MILATLLILLTINALTIAAFAEDKRRAVAGEWRTREFTLLSLALVGGSPGAFWARRRFRHKTRKQPFGSRLELIAMLQTGVSLGLIVAFSL